MVLSIVDRHGSGTEEAFARSVCGIKCGITLGVGEAVIIAIQGMQLEVTKEEQPHNSPVKNPAVILRPSLNYLFNREELQKIEGKKDVCESFMCSAQGWFKNAH